MDYATIQEKVIEVVSQLGLANSDISPETAVFDAGIDSISILIVVSQVESSCDCRYEGDIGELLVAAALRDLAMSLARSCAACGSARDQ